MVAECNEQSVAVGAPSTNEAGSSSLSLVLYQGAIVLATLMFLISFWSC